MIGTWAKSSKFFKQISIWSSPHSAIKISPVDSKPQTTKGSELDNFFNPVMILGKSYAFFGFTVTLTTGDTEYFIDLIG